MAGTSDLDRQIEQLRRCEYIKEAREVKLKAERHLAKLGHYHSTAVRY